MILNIKINKTNKIIIQKPTTDLTVAPCMCIFHLSITTDYKYSTVSRDQDTAERC